MKRQRGRGRKPGGGGGGGHGHSHNHGNRSLESNGPDVKIRGTAAQIYEKYSQYARDAQSGGDRVKYENYLQHAEHYYRVMAATMPRERLLQQQGGEGSYATGQPAPEGVAAQPGEAGAPQGELHETARPHYEDSDEDATVEAEADGGEEDGENDSDSSEETATEAGAREEDRGEGEQGERHGRNRRGRRRRRPADGQIGDRPSQRQGGGDPEARSALDNLARRQGALAGG